MAESGPTAPLGTKTEASPEVRPVGQKGLVGTLFVPAGEAHEPYPAVLVLGGSEGGMREDFAQALAGEGFAALTVAYFGSKGLPSSLMEIPLEYFASAMSWLEKQPEVKAEAIAVLGGSKGGELALVLAAAYPERIGAVVAYVPSGVVWQGIPSHANDFRKAPRSSWTREGRPVPFLPSAKPSFTETVKFLGFLVGRPGALRPLYERGLEDLEATADATIAVERIQGPVLLLSGSDDQVWPSTTLSEAVIRRLKEHNHPYPDEHLAYQGAGHLFGVPGAVRTAGRSQSGRANLGGKMEANEAALVDSWPKVLGFLRRSIG